MDIHQGFRGKYIFATGVTGFVGKVWLWKLLKEFPDLGGVYLLVRPKKGVQPDDRVEKEIFGSMCFDGLAKDLGPEEWARRKGKVHGVAGDIMLDRLGLSDKDYQTLCDKCNHLVHLAATIDFNEKLHTSVKMNVLGTLRVFALAQRCRNMEGFIHVSTCYVNFNRSSPTVPVKEVLYPLGFDPEAMCKFILSLNDNQIPTETARLLKKYNYPNTYTFTKSMAEQIVHRRKGNLPVCIVRPSIVAASHREPYPGWCDVLTAAGGIFLTAGLGILHELNCRGEGIADVVPVDFVANTLIKVQFKLQMAHQRQKALSAAAPRSAAAPKALIIEASGAKGTEGGPSVISVRPSTTGATVGSSGPNGDNLSDEISSFMPTVFQSSTSASCNPLIWNTCLDSVGFFTKKYGHPKAIQPFDVVLLPHRPQYLFRFYSRRVLPTKALQLVARLPIVGNEKQLKDLERYEKALKKVQELDKNFQPFMNRVWLFDCSNSEYLNEELCDRSAKAFSNDIYDINWWAYAIAYSCGLVRYVMKVEDGRERPPMPESGSEIFMKAAL